MAVVLRPHSYKGRIFGPEQIYGDPYVGVLLVTWQGPDIVEIDLTLGEMSRDDVLDLCYQLRDLGVKIVRAWRADNHRLPRSKPVRTEGRFTLWEGEVDKAIAALERA